MRHFIACTCTELWKYPSNRYKVYLTIIPRARVGYAYEMVDSQRGAQRRVGYNYLISNKREWNNCFIKKLKKYLKISYKHCEKNEHT